MASLMKEVEEPLDEGGYPTQEVLSYISNYNVVEGDSLELMQLVYDLWSYDYPYKGCYLSEEEDFVHVYNLSTGGWSGNEDLVYALKENHLWWMLNWYSSRRGGHYEFRIKLWKHY